MGGANLHRELLNRARSIQLYKKVNRVIKETVNKGGTADNEDLIGPLILLKES